MGWGTLEIGKTYEFALLRVDIAGNSRLVRRYPRSRIKTVYGSVKDLVTRLVEKREGRIWGWEGDGGLAAFYFIDKTIQATLCGMEILHELFLYNLLGKGLPEPVLVRLAVHARSLPIPSVGKGVGGGHYPQGGAAGVPLYASRLSHRVAGGLHGPGQQAFSPLRSRARA